MGWSDYALRYAACWYCMTLHGFDPSQPSFPHRPRPMRASVLLRPARGGVGGWVLKNSAMPSRPRLRCRCRCCLLRLLHHPGATLAQGARGRELAFRPQVWVAITEECG